MSAEASSPPSATIAAVLSAFNPPEGFDVRVRHLASLFQHVVVVDDGSDSVAPDRFADEPRILVIALPENRGIAHALNVGIERALQEGADHVVTLDQDSDLDDHYLERALEAEQAALATLRRVGVVVPATVGGAPALQVQRDGRPAPFDPIQSGAMFPADVLRAVGPFREELFIDAVDSDYTLRLQRAGYELVLVDELELDHALGELVPIMVFGRQLRLAGRPRHVVHHSAFRTYYMVRNSIDLTRRYRGHARWHLLRWRKMGSMILAGAVLGPDSGAQFRAIRYGVRDGFAHRLGRIRPDVLQRIRGTRAA
ncbi:glycosyltransferase [Agromyces intestinalis]|uniref:glycosyltransferase n=1 Tax=Agromyces intestinalis TaxID=2592652 RepID=UPI00143CEC09|nr:glycosyltransferase [Agromyces intestinalis]